MEEPQPVFEAIARRWNQMMRKYRRSVISRNIGVLTGEILRLETRLRNGEVFDLDTIQQLEHLQRERSYLCQKLEELSR